MATKERLMEGSIAPPLVSDLSQTKRTYIANSIKAFAKKYSSRDVTLIGMRNSQKEVEFLFEKHEVKFRPFVLRTNMIENDEYRTSSLKVEISLDDILSKPDQKRILQCMQDVKNDNERIQKEFVSSIKKELTLLPIEIMTSRTLTVLNLEDRIRNLQLQLSTHFRENQ